MRVVTLNSSVTVPGGANLCLTHEQAVAREGLLAPVDTKDIAKALGVLQAAKAARKAARDADKDTSAADGKVEAARAALTKVRGTYKAKVPVFFKGGEQIGFEGNPNGAEVREALGLPDQAANAELDAARAAGVQAGRAALLAEVAAYNEALDAAEAAQEAMEEAECKLEAETDPGKRPALEKALAAAKRAATEAEAAAQALKPVA